jgi:hypothetical protein
MPNVITFTAELEIFKTINQLKDLDDRVNEFIRENGVKTVHSISDTTTSDNTGKTMGIIRVMVYD